VTVKPLSLDRSFAGYDPAEYFCELTTAADDLGRARAMTIERLSQLSIDELRQRSADADRELFNLGITFTVYSDRNATDRILPFDLIPRLISTAEWRHVEAGVIQRVTALNLFLQDIYGPQKVLADKILPADLVLGHPQFRDAMRGFAVPGGVFVHVAGIDLVRDENGRFLVLEDNARTPSGVSYVVENRHMMLRAFPELFADIPVLPVDNYGPRLRQSLATVAPQRTRGEPQIVLLSPGMYNSAYFEHIFLAREMGIPLVEGRDLVLDDDRVFMKTTDGLSRVDVIYRRIDDDFLDPEMFRPDSMLGVKGLMRAYRRGNITLANAVGTGIADDKAVYAYMPRLIRYYLGEDAILPNVDTRICREPDALSYTLDHLEELVLKPVGASGGYGIVIGPRSSRAELEEARAQLRADPANFISQPMIRLSVAPTLTPEGIQPRHLDLRPFAVTGKDTWVLPGGLTRVALKKGSLVVNSSQGGGSKDTWVLGTGAPTG
jgi:uncharacterized circularly permuted ATP-grasp superfamily protein